MYAHPQDAFTLPTSRADCEPISGSRPASSQDINPVQDRLASLFEMAFAPGFLSRVALCLAGPLPLLAQGGPPLLTDDPGTPGNKNWEINISSTQFWSNTQRELQSPLLDINYGLGDAIQLKYQVPYLFASDGGGPFKGGLGNSLLGVKWRFYQRSETGWHISIYPQLELNNPDNSNTRQIVDKGPRFLLPLEVSKEFGPLEVNFEAGYWFAKRTPDNQSPRERILGLAFGHQFTRRFEGLCEFYDDVLLGGGDRSVTFDVGGRYEFRKGLLLLLMAGRGLGRVQGQSVSFIGYFGLQVQITHGPKKRRGLRGQAGNP
jgi:hypothetical protein